MTPGNLYGALMMPASQEMRRWQVIVICTILSLGLNDLSDHIFSSIPSERWWIVHIIMGRALVSYVWISVHQRLVGHAAVSFWLNIILSGLTPFALQALRIRWDDQKQAREGQNEG